MIRQGVSDALLSVASLLGYLVLISLQYSLMLVLAVRTAAHKWKHKLSFVPLNSATGHSALVALKECTSHLNGLPKDVGLAVLEDDVNLAAVSKLILWCMAVGIKTLSVYDINGESFSPLKPGCGIVLDLFLLLCFLQYVRSTIYIRYKKVLVDSVEEPGMLGSLTS